MRVSQPQQKLKIFKGEVVQPATNHWHLVLSWKQAKNNNKKKNKTKPEQCCKVWEEWKRKKKSKGWGCTRHLHILMLHRQLTKNKGYIIYYCTAQSILEYFSSYQHRFVPTF
jgi:hypothetical protein